MVLASATWAVGRSDVERTVGGESVAAAGAASARMSSATASERLSEPWLVQGTRPAT